MKHPYERGETTLTTPETAPADELPLDEAIIADEPSEPIMATPDYEGPPAWFDTDVFEAVAPPSSQPYQGPAAWMDDDASEALAPPAASVAPAELTQPDPVPEPEPGDPVDLEDEYEYPEMDPLPEAEPGDPVEPELDIPEDAPDFEIVSQQSRHINTPPGRTAFGCTTASVSWPNWRADVNRALRRAASVTHSRILQLLVNLPAVWQAFAICESGGYADTIRDPDGVDPAGCSWGLFQWLDCYAPSFLRNRRRLGALAVNLPDPSEYDLPDDMDSCHSQEWGQILTNREYTPWLVALWTIMFGAVLSQSCTISANGQLVGTDDRGRTIADFFNALHGRSGIPAWGWAYRAYGHASSINGLRNIARGDYASTLARSSARFERAFNEESARAS